LRAEDKKSYICLASLRQEKILLSKREESTNTLSSACLNTNDK